MNLEEFLPASCHFQSLCHGLKGLGLEICSGKWPTQVERVGFAAGKVRNYKMLLIATV